MALTVATNTGALMAQAAASSVNKDMETSMERLSTGNRINSAADDAAGVTIVSRMNAQVKGLNQAIRNAADGQSMASTAEGAMIEIESMLQRMRELAVQSANGSNSDNDRANLNKEVTELKAEIDRIVSTTEFNGKNLLNGSADMSLQIGAVSGQNMTFSIAGLGTSSLGTVTGTATTGTVRESSYQGTEAGTTEVQLAFQGNDTFTFKIDTAHLDSSSAAITLDVAAVDVANSSAAAIAAEINAQAADAGIDGFVSATVSGNVVKISDSAGGALTVDTYSATSGTTTTFTTIAGGSASDASKALGAAPSNVSDAFSTAAPSGGAVAHSAATDATNGTAAIFDLTIASTDLANLASTNHLEVNFGSYTVTTANADADTLGNFAAAVNAEQSDWTFAVSGDVLTATALNVGTHSAITINEVVTATGALDGSGTALAASSSGTASMAVNTAGVDAVAAAAESGGNNLYLDLGSADTYSMTIDTTAIDFTFDGTTSGLTNVASVVNTAMGSGYQVSVQDGQVRVLKEDGTAIALASFTSDGNGTITASTDAATAGAKGSSELLDDTTYATTATAATMGTAVASTAVLSFTGADTYSFKISDGDRTAVVNATSVPTVDDAGTADLLAEINYALEQAGMDASITAAVDSGTAGQLILTQSAGKEITFSDFKSDADGAMGTAAGATGGGVAKFLDDGDASNAQAVSQVTLNTVTSSETAISIIDAALEDVASGRAGLGSVINRLDHTINSLTNVSVNTSASMGRINDADFAAETTALSKAQILQQASTAMLAQANASKQNVLSLLQG